MPYASERRHLTEDGKAVLAAAVSINQDWALPASAYDQLHAALGGMSKDDLEAARLLADILVDAVVVRLMQCDAEERRAGQGNSGTKK